MNDEGLLTAADWELLHSPALTPEHHRARAQMIRQMAAVLISVGVPVDESAVTLALLRFDEQRRQVVGGAS